MENTQGRLTADTVDVYSYYYIIVFLSVSGQLVRTHWRGRCARLHLEDTEKGHLQHFGEDHQLEGR